MDALTCQFREILKIRNCPAVHALLLDVWAVALEKGEAEGLLWAANVRRGVEVYERHEKMLAAYGRWDRHTEGDE